MKKNTTKKDSRIKVTDGVFVSHINNYSDDCTFFNLTLNSVLGDITIYSCKVITGRNGDFITFPSRKGSDNNYYSHVFVNIDDNMKSDILNAISSNI